MSELDEQGICMNCGAEMDYSPMHPWCLECSEDDDENDEKDEAGDE